VAVQFRREGTEALGAWLKARPGHRIALLLDGSVAAVTEPGEAAPASLEFDEPTWTGLDVLGTVDLLEAGGVPGLYREVGFEWGYWPDLDLFVKNLSLSGSSSLTLESVKEMEEKASAALDPRPPLWFAENRRMSVTIYGEPDRRENRLGFGRALRFEEAGEGKTETFAYVRVLPAGDPAASRLPMALDMPFPLPKGIEASILVELVDFLRGGPAKTFGEGEAAYTVRFAPDRPLLSIEKEGDLFVAKTGVLYGPDLGAGQVAKLRKTDKGIELADLGWWWK
jgi:hypothetical protein